MLYVNPGDLGCRSLISSGALPQPTLRLGFGLQDNMEAPAGSLQRVLGRNNSLIAIIVVVRITLIEVATTIERKTAILVVLIPWVN